MADEWTIKQVKEIKQLLRDLAEEIKSLREEVTTLLEALYEEDDYE